MTEKERVLGGRGEITINGITYSKKISEDDIKNISKKYGFGLKQMRSLAKQKSLFLIRDGKKIIGCLQLKPHKSLVDFIFVDNLYRKKGIGGTLLRLAELDAAKRGKEKLNLTSLVSTEGFYEKRGWTDPEGFGHFNKQTKDFSYTKKKKQFKHGKH